MPDACHFRIGLMKVVLPRRAVACQYGHLLRYLRTHIAISVLVPAGEPFYWRLNELRGQITCSIISGRPSWQERTVYIPIVLSLVNLTSHQ